MKIYRISCMLQPGYVVTWADNQDHALDNVKRSLTTYRKPEDILPFDLWQFVPEHIPFNQIKSN